jgi:hypothetical protein
MKTERARLEGMERDYDEYVRHAGVTQRDLARQRGIVLGIRLAMVHVLQEEWCAKNEHPVPMVTLGDVDRLWP